MANAVAGCSNLGFGFGHVFDVFDAFMVLGAVVLWAARAHLDSAIA